MKTRIGLWILLSGLMACAEPATASIEDLGSGSILDSYSLVSVTGLRDGDRLPAQIVFSDQQGQLVMGLNFRVGVPTELVFGQYRWEKENETLEGQVRALSVTFLGGQSDRPNLGGRFELLSSSGSALYRVTVPTTQIEPPG